MTEKYITRSSEIAARMLGGEMMIMSATDSTFFTLNEVATAIWQAADGHTPLSQIINNAICGQFDVEPETARADAEEFISQLAEHGILLVSNQPSTQAEAS
jgi:coenzyme PQQ synthesis protein D (PqqD)